MFIAFRLVVKKSVEEAEVIMEVEAKMLFTNRFRNLFSAVPRLYVLFRDGVMSLTVEEPVIDSEPCRVVEPETVRFVIVVVARVEVPITVKFSPMLNDPITP